MSGEHNDNALARWLGWKGWVWIIWMVGILLVCLQIGFRQLDRDEGFYLFGAWRVFQGEIPYQDFFYPQAPYLPYIYALTVGLFSDGILGGRMLSALFTIGLAVLCATWVSRRSGDTRLGMAAGGLMLFGNLGLYWHSAVKTYAPSDLLLVSGFVLLMAAFRAMRTSKVFLPCLLSGICFGLALQVRLVLAGAVPYILFLALLAPGWSRVKRFLGLALGMVIASIPALILFVGDPQRYWFQNLTFHLTARLPDPWWRFAVQKVTALGEYLGNLDILVLVVLCAVGLWGMSRKQSELSGDFRREVWMGIGLAGILFATYLTAPPLLPQYLVQLTPFLVFGAAAGIGVVLREPKGSTGAVIVLLMVLVYGGWGVGKTIGRVVERQDLAPLYGIATVREVGQYLDSVTNEDDQVMAFWPAYLVAAKRNAVAGTGFGKPSFRLEWRNSPEVIHWAGLKTQADFSEMIANGVPAAVITGFDTPLEMLPVLQEYYQLDREIGGVQIFVRPKQNQ